jgi:hypothetical protein
LQIGRTPYHLFLLFFGIKSFQRRIGGEKSDCSVHRTLPKNSRYNFDTSLERFFRKIVGRTDYLRIKVV